MDNETLFPIATKELVNEKIGCSFENLKAWQNFIKMVIEAGAIP